MIKISYYNSDRLIFWKILKRDCVNFFSKRKLEKSILKKIFSIGPVKIKKSGCCRAVYIGLLPVVGIVFKGNLKIAINLFGMTLVTLKRSGEIVQRNAGEIHCDSNRTKRRLYINMGNLPYSDGNTGIPRVAKKLLEEGISDKEIEVLPVYFERDSLQLKIARNYLLEKHNIKPSKAYDETVSINPGDVVLNVLADYIEIVGYSKIFEKIEELHGKVIFTVHDILPIQFPEYFKELTVKRYQPWLVEVCHYDGILAVSKTVLGEVREWAKRNNIKTGKEFIWDYYYLGSDFKKADENINHEEEVIFNQISKRPYFLQVSTIEPRKGYDQLLAAFDLLWEKGFDFNAVFVGNKGWKVDNLCKNIEADKEKNKKLFWLSGVSDRFLQKIYKNCWAVIFASRGEGFGLPLIEGLSFGKPVLARDIPIFREIAGNKVSYFSGNEPEKLAFAIRQMTQKQSNKIETIEATTWHQSFLTIKNLLF